MEPLSTIFLYTGIVSALSFSGVILAFKNMNSWFVSNTRLLITFTAGVFVMTSIGLIGETFHLLSSQTAVIAVVGGFVGMLLLHKIVPETHHHQTSGCVDCLPKKSAVKVLLGDTLHNTADGIVIVASFSISPELGLLTLLSVGVHEIIQEISEYILLRNSGYSIKKTLFLNFISSLSIFIGVFIGIFLTQSTHLQAILLGISGGAFLHIVFHDLVPYNSIKNMSSRQACKHSLVFLLGICIMIGISFLAPHSHEEEQHFNQQKIPLEEKQKTP